jgi:YD repeat-containing protein
MAYQPSFCERERVQTRYVTVADRHQTVRSRLQLLIASLLAWAICVTGLFGLPSEIAHAQSGSVGYVYDSLGRVIAAYDPSGNAAAYKYDAVGNLLSIANYASTQFGGIGLSSNSGQTGSTLTIYGTGFCSSPTVTINGTNATVVSSTSIQIVVTVPSGATSAAVVVTCGSNQITVGTFTVGSFAPSIRNFTPTIAAGRAPASAAS